MIESLIQSHRIFLLDVPPTHQSPKGIIATLKEAVLKKLHHSHDIFTNLCANDFDANPKIFAQQIDKMRIADLILVESNTPDFCQSSISEDEIPVLLPSDSDHDNPDVFFSLALTDKGKDELARILKREDYLQKRLHVDTKSPDGS